MKLLVVSDLHLEYHEDKGKSLINSLDKNCDVICCAGDLSTYDMLEDSVKLLCDNFPRVVFVAGNHEFWNGSFLKVFKKLDKLEQTLTNFNWLENKEIEINGKRFIGATLWFDKSEKAIEYKDWLDDFRLIENFEKLVFSKFDISKCFFSKRIKEGDIVISHHLPSFKCISERFQNNKYKIYFASNLEKIILDNKPKCWITAHSHYSVDITIGTTKIISNPFGHIKCLNPKFNNNFIVDI